MSILNKYKRWNPILTLDRRNIWDFALTQSPQKSLSNGSFLKEYQLSTYIDLNDKECVSDNILISKDGFYWDKSVCMDASLKNIGLTAVDSGFIPFRHDKITNKEYINILTNSIWSNNDNDFSLKLHPVHSNSGVYSLPYEFKNDNFKYVSLNGGFFQGFFKSNNTNYQILPDFIEDTLHIEITLRPQDYYNAHNSLNCIHPNNKGIFFYIGIRSENKLLKEYGYDLSKYPIREVESINEFICDGIYEGNYIVNNNILGDMNLQNDYFNDEYIVNEDYGYFKDEAYLEKDINPLEVEVKDDRDLNLSVNGYYEIKTDNKFLFFNDTKDGFNTKTWQEGDIMLLTGVTTNNKYNLYTLLNNTKSGYTTETIEKYYEENKETIYDFSKDIINNAIAFKVNEDGSISYRYAVLDCNLEDKIGIIEEKTLPNLIKNGEWYTINIQICNVSGINDDCKTYKGDQKMQIKFYINGKLKFISKELPKLNLRPLDELEWRQEGVAYNISLGGGTMGLCDSIINDYYHPFEYITPIEKNFAGTFNGDIKSLKIYTGKMQSNEIENNYLYERSLLK